jgi:uncharacterized protein (TIGR02145 family)
MVLLRVLLTFGAALCLTKLTAQNDANLINEARYAIDRQDCRGAVKALSDVSPEGKGEAFFIYYSAKAYECAGDLATSLNYYKQYQKLFPSLAEISDKVAKLSYEIRKREEQRRLEEEQRRLAEQQVYERKLREEADKTAEKEAEKAKLEEVKIGTQLWSSKNLNVSTFLNGDSIKEAKTWKEWNQACNNQQPAWCYYGFRFTYNGTKCGKFYNLAAVNDSRGLAPQGWHIPTVGEWNKLIAYLGGKDNAGLSMKSTSGWDGKTWGGKSLGLNGNNVSGFNCMGCGYRNFDGIFLGGDNNQQSAYFWISSKNKTKYLNLNNTDHSVFIGNQNEEIDKFLGFAVRCIKD